MSQHRQSVQRRIASLGAVAVLGVVLAGCSATNQITTSLPYSPSDGVRATLGEVKAQNLFVLTEQVGDPASVQGALTNLGSSRLTVEVSAGDEGVIGTVDLAAGETAILGGSDGETLLYTATQPPGAVTPLTLATGPAGTETFQVPVLDGSLPQYAPFVPAPTPTPASTVAPSDAATPSAG